jgi:phosphohistidine phosphatase
MIELLLLRHAKSAWDRPGVDDHERDLAPRGEAAAPRVGELIAASGLVPDLVLCSTAVRARRTWELVVDRLPAAPKVRLRREIYLAAPETMLKLVQAEGGSARRALLVGHNPGMHAFARRLAGSGDAKLRARLAEKFPTAALARIAFDLDDWRGLAPGKGELRGFWRPRDLDGPKG